MVDAPALVAEATKKSGIVWLGVPGQPRPVAVWHVWREDGAYLVVGPGEQPVPALVDATTCTVTVRSTDTGGRIVTWDAVVSRVQPGTDRWHEVVPALLAGRLNLPDAAGAESRWSRTCAVLRLAPTGAVSEAGDSLPAGSLSAPAPESAARTPTRLPYLLGRRRRPSG